MNGINRRRNQGAVDLAGAGTGLLGFATTSASGVHLARSFGVPARVDDSGGITVVRVDASKFTTIPSLDSVNKYVTLALGRAVSAGAIEFAIVIGIKVDDVNCSTTIVLDNLVASLEGATTNNPRLLAGLVLLDADSIFTDVLKPDKVQGAGSFTVNTSA